MEALFLLYYLREKVSSIRQALLDFTRSIIPGVKRRNNILNTIPASARGILTG